MFESKKYYKIGGSFHNGIILVKDIRWKSKDRKFLINFIWIFHVNKEVDLHTVHSEYLTHANISGIDHTEMTKDQVYAEIL